MSNARTELRRVVSASMSGWWTDPRDVDRRTDEIYNAIRREERERCADLIRNVTVFHPHSNRVLSDRIRALPDEDTPTTEETPESAELPDYIEIAYSRITRVWGVTCTTCPHTMRNAGTTEDAAANLARMHLNHHHRGWNKTA